MLLGALLSVGVVGGVDVVRDGSSDLSSRQVIECPVDYRSQEGACYWLPDEAAGDDAGVAAPAGEVLVVAVPSGTPGIWVQDELDQPVQVDDPLLTAEQVYSVKDLRDPAILPLRLSEPEATRGGLRARAAVDLRCEATAGEAFDALEATAVIIALEEAPAAASGRDPYPLTLAVPREAWQLITGGRVGRCRLLRAAGAEG